MTVPGQLAPAPSPALELLRLSLPMIGMTVSRMLMGFIDFAMVSQLGTAAQAAISPSTILLFAISCVGMGMAQGVQTFVSQADGRGEPERAGPYLWQTIYIALASALVTAPIALLTPVWFEWLGRLAQHPDEVRWMEIRFLTIALWSVGPMTACAGLESFYNGIRQPRIGLFAVLASLVTITIANYAFIFGHFGFPAMGIAGSGLATLVAWVVRLAILLAALRRPSIDRRYGVWRSARPSSPELWDIVRVGGPVALQWLVDVGAWVIFMEMMIPPFGETAMAASTITVQYMHLSFMPALGVGMALTTQVGNAVGAGQPDDAVRRVRLGQWIIVAYMGVMALLFVVAGGPLAALFTGDAAVVGVAVTLLLWTAAFQVPDALCITYSFALRGAGDTKVPAMLFAACCWGIFVAGGTATAFLLPRWGVNGPWALCTLYIVVLSGLLWWRFHSRAWERIRLFERSAPGPAAAPLAEQAEPSPELRVAGGE